ncbi:WD40-repeat-containing domain protein [Mycena epipterygia]|nr:WD40-repeat-containing domain protein [Mycena epipterygia]
MERELTGHSNRVRCVAFAQDGTRLASGSDDKTIRVWNVSTGEKERTFSGHSAWVRSVIFSPNGSRIASGSDDGTIRIWNVSTGENQLKLTAPSDWMRSVAFSLDGLYVSGTSQDTTRMWNLQTGDLKEEIRHDMLGPSGLRMSTNIYWNYRQGVLSLGQEGEQPILQSPSGETGNRLWIWPDYRREISCSATNGTRVCFGYKSGRVVIIDLAEWCFSRPILN